MIKLFGKSLIFTDLHVGVKGDIPSRLNLSIKAIEEILKIADTEKIDNIIFLGDWFHSREYIHTATLTVGYQLMSLLATNHKVVIVAGNHDIQSNSYRTISPLYTFASIENVYVIHEITELALNDKLCLVVPWGFAEANTETKYDYVFGHLNVAGTAIRYNRVIGDISDNSAYITTSINDVRTFAKVLKPNGVCFSGHVHLRTEHIYRSNKIIFVGSPYELNFGETSSVHGLYILDTTTEPRFVEIPNMPKHVIMKVSECVTNGKLKDKSYFKKFDNAIIKKLIDVDLPADQQTALNDIMSELDMYDFVESELCYNLISADETVVDGINVEKMTLLSYINTVFDTMSNDIFETADTTKDHLTNVFKEYAMEYNI